MTARRTAAVVIAAAVTGLAAPSASAEVSNFGELLPGLPPLNSQTNQQIADLAQTQLDPNADSENNCPSPLTADQNVPGHGCTGSGFTYFGQFIDHDLTLDTSPSPLAPVDFTKLVNNRTFRFDLDQVYGGGPNDPASAKLYAADKKHFLIQEPNPNGVRDLPRNPDGSAILVEARQDENQILAQMQVAFLKFHNRLIDQGFSFRKARRLTTLYYQHAVVDDFLPHTLGSTVPTFQSARNIIRLVRTGMTPIEFSVAAYRFGHSQVRRAYFLNDDLNVKVQVFSLDPTVDTLMGGRNILARHQINWAYFLPELEENDITPDEPRPDAADSNHGRKIDELISSSLFALPIPGAEAAGSNVLAFRNMIRAKFYNMPSGQSVARRLGIRPLTRAELAVPSTLDTAFANGVPLWYYVLREASVINGGRTLGPVGSRIVSDTFTAELLRDPNSILRNNRNWRPSRFIAGADRKVQLSEMLTFAQVTGEPDAAPADPEPAAAVAAENAEPLVEAAPEDPPGTVPPEVPGG